MSHQNVINQEEDDILNLHPDDDLSGDLDDISGLTSFETQSTFDSLFPSTPTTTTTATTATTTPVILEQNNIQPPRTLTLSFSQSQTPLTSFPSFQNPIPLESLVYPASSSAGYIPFTTTSTIPYSSSSFPSSMASMPPAAQTFPLSGLPSSSLPPPSYSAVMSQRNQSSFPSSSNSSFLPSVPAKRSSITQRSLLNKQVSHPAPVLEYDLPSTSNPLPLSESPFPGTPIRTQVYIQTLNSTGNPKLTHICSFHNLTPKPQGYLTDEFYQDIQNSTLRHLKNAVPYVQLQQIGVRHEIFGMTASYAIESQTKRSKLFELNFPLLPSLIQIAPPPLLLVRKNAVPFISVNVYFELKLHKPPQDHYILSRQDKDLLDLFMTVLKSGQSSFGALQTLPSTPTSHPISKPNTSQIPLSSTVREAILIRSQNLLQTAKEKSKRRRMAKRARLLESPSPETTPSTLHKEDNF